MRTFISIPLPEKIKDEIVKIQTRLPKFEGKSVEKENLHLTLKFLGEISPDLVNNVKSSLSSIKFKPLKLVIGSVGTFSYQNNPRIVWLKVEGAHDLQRKIDIALSDLFPKEERFMSHLTIARIKLVSNAGDFKKHLEKIEYNKLEFASRSFSLKESVLKHSGPVFSTIQKYPCSN